MFRRFSAASTARHCRGRWQSESSRALDRSPSGAFTPCEFCSRVRRPISRLPQWPPRPRRGRSRAQWWRQSACATPQGVRAQ
eukprot:1599779-Pyramimonas_sp.AAC.1